MYIFNISPTTRTNSDCNPPQYLETRFDGLLNTMPTEEITSIRRVFDRLFDVRFNNCQLTTSDRYRLIAETTRVFSFAPAAFSEFALDWLDERVRKDWSDELAEQRREDRGRREIPWENRHNHYTDHVGNQSDRILDGVNGGTFRGGTWQVHSGSRPRNHRRSAILSDGPPSDRYRTVDAEERPILTSTAASSDFLGLGDEHFAGPGIVSQPSSRSSTPDPFDEYPHDQALPTEAPFDEGGQDVRTSLAPCPVHGSDYHDGYHHITCTCIDELNEINGDGDFQSLDASSGSTAVGEEEPGELRSPEGLARPDRSGAPSPNRES